MPNNLPTIGAVARKVGVNVETVRYYQRIGLLEEPPKNGGFRFYSEDFIERLRFIRRAKELGFSLKEITELLENSCSSCSKVKDMLVRKKDELKQEIVRLHDAAGELDQMISACKSHADGQTCPVVPGRP